MLIAIVMLGVGLGGGYWIERWRRAQVPAVPTPNVVTRDDKLAAASRPCVRQEARVHVMKDRFEGRQCYQVSGGSVASALSVRTN
jgi:hypothetical protein